MTSTFRTLGCSGGIGFGLSTTAFLLDNDILIDAGTGVGDLTLDELRQINYIFLTHSHLDHIAGVPFIADAVGASRDKPLLVYGTATTLDALKQHILNNVIWPDFTTIPSQSHPFVRLVPIEINQIVNINHREIVALPVMHSIPANGYAVTSPSGNTLIFSGDTGPCDAFWQAANATTYLKHLIVETSFNDAEEDLAKISGHFSPRLLVDDLSKLQQPQTQIWISHLKPDGGDSIFDEIVCRVNDANSAAYAPPRKLTKGTTLTF
jgi:cAMP phosphodiesterase